MNLLSCLIRDSLLVGIFGSLIAGFITLALVEWYKQYKISCENKNFKKVNKTIPAAIKKLAKERENYRKNQEWQKADQARMEIEKQGFTVEDTKSGPAIKSI